MSAIFLELFRPPVTIANTKENQITWPDTLVIRINGGIFLNSLFYNDWFICFSMITYLMLQ